MEILFDDEVWLHKFFFKILFDLI